MKTVRLWYLQERGLIIKLPSGVAYTSSPVCSFLSVDRELAHQSMEAWVHVVVDEQPPDLDSSDFPFCGFGKAKGVLTWYNSG